jgi:signal transduction histidine kinase
MKSLDVNYFTIGPRLALTFAFLIVLILGGNALLIWQFHVARLQTDRLTGASQQMIAVLRLQNSLLSFHQRLDELVQTKDEQRLAAEAEPLRRTLLEQTQATKSALTHLPPETRVDPAFLSTLDAVEITLRSQLKAVIALATLGDWEAVRRRLGNELKPAETLTSALVNSMDQELSGELTEAVANMSNVQRRILLIVPTTAIFTFFIAAFFAWAITKRIIELRLEERITERTRIAQELHDTLLQGVVSASMQLNVAVEQMPEDSPVRPALNRILQVMGQVIDEGRNILRGMGSSVESASDLTNSFSRIPQELCKPTANYRVVVEGSALPLRPAIRDEVYRIGREALANAFWHSGAGNIDLLLVYSAHELRVLVGDDGCGIDPEVLQSGREGHWGLSGMRERAQRIGGKLKISSRTGSGTQVELRLPSTIAWESHRMSRASEWFRGLYRRHRQRTQSESHERVGK